MKNTTLWIALAWTLGLTASTFAVANESGVTTPHATLMRSEEPSTRLFLGASTIHRDWNFYVGPPASQHLLSGMVGLEHLKSDSCYWRLTCSYQGGNASGYWYDRETEVQAHLGYSFAFLDESLLLTPYAGLGYFYNSEPQSTGGIYTENYNYLPLGLLANWRFNENWSIGMRSQLNVIFERRLELDSSELTVHKRSVWCSELPITYRFQEKFDLSLVPFYTYGYDVTYGNNLFQYDWGAMHTYGARIELGYYL